MYVCICNQISDKQITDLVGSGEVKSYEELKERTGVADCCGRCDSFARDCVNEAKSLTNKLGCQSGHQFNAAVPALVAQGCEA